MDETYFLKDAVQYAKFQGRAIDDKEFVELFQKHLNNLPSSKVLKKKWLELFIATTTEEYNKHIAGMKGNCETHCQYTLAYYRGIPHAQAELRKIDPMYLGAEKVVTLLKGIPNWFLRKMIPSIEPSMPHQSGE